MNPFYATIKEAKLRGELIVYGFVQPNGVVRFSCSRTDPFAGADVPREVITGSRKVQPSDIERIHQIAAQVRASYGEDAVGALPELPKRKRQRKVA